ncbi:MAG: type II toxin-antitoxin system HicA family toxin [Bacillota bacterium]|uniref:type II toxin-antitoxin system HicA family toxin n=1 Tax=Desulfurispora thermophila TaxID=265470 RepID=UPI000A00FFC0
MSPRLPRVTAKQLIRALTRAGFVLGHKGSTSHRFYVHSEDRSRYAVVPVHGKDIIPVGTLAEILRTAKITPDELRDLL